MRLLAFVLAAAALAAGCGSDGSTDEDESRAAAAPAEPLTVEEALASTLDEPILVEGALLADGSGTRLCGALAESYPPQCGGAALVVQGLDLEDLPHLQRADRVRWADRPVQLLGTVEDGVLTVSATMQ